jgi:hypothetical protein
LRLSWTISFNKFRRSKLIAKIFTGLAILGLLAVVGFVFWISWQLVRFLRTPEFAQVVDNPTTLLNSIPVLFFTVLFVGILLTSFGVLLQALYLAADMDFLLAAPIPIRAVFITKLLQAVLPNLSISVLFGLPILYGLGFARGFNFLYYPAILLMMVLLSLTAAGLASLLVMLVVRVFPARRVVEVLGFGGAILSFVCSQTGNMINVSRGGGPSSGSEVNQMVGALSYLARFNNPWIPLNWPGQGIAALGEGIWLQGLGLTLISVVLAAGAFWISLQTAERWYYTGWAGMQVVAQKKRPARTSRKAVYRPKAEGINELVTRILSAPVRGLIWKDAMVLRRDLRNLSQLITPLIFGVIYGFMILRGGSEPPGGRGEAPAWFMESMRTVLHFSNIGLSVLVGWMLLGRLASMGFSAEGKNYWILKAAPLSARQLLTAKFLVAYLPSLGLSLLFLILMTFMQKVDLATAIYSVMVLILCLAGMAGIMLGFGVAGVNFTWIDPRRISGGKMGCLSSLVTIVFLPIVLVVFIGPLVLAGFLGVPVVYAYLIGGLFGMSLSIVATLLPLRLVAPRVERLNEE